MMATEHAMNPITIFFSYAPEDKALSDELAMHLKALQRTHGIKTWGDQLLLPGEEWQQQIQRHLDTADLILLLISPDFLNTQDQWSSTINQAIQRHERGEARVIPILLRQCSWKETSLAHLDILPRDDIPVITWRDRDEIWCDIAKDLRYIVKNRLINQWKDDADILYRQRHYEDALAAYNQILLLDHENIAASICKGNVCLDLHRYDEALTAYEHASSCQSTLEKKGRSMESFSTSQQLYEDALQVYDRLLQQTSYHSPSSDIEQDIMLEDVPKRFLHETAIADLNLAIQHNPVNPFLYHIKGNIFLELGRYEEAIGAYEQAIHLKQDFEPSRTRFSKVVQHISRQEYQKLNVLVRQAIEKAKSIRDRET
jgi:tetratricopeptide (TPR) repeat protein